MAAAQELEARADLSSIGIGQVLQERLVSLALTLRYCPLCLLESRCDKDLDTLSGYALCLPNLARLQTYHFAEHRPILCVEIKVKFCKREWCGEKGKVGSSCESMDLPEHTFPQKLLLSSQDQHLLGTPSASHSFHHTTCSILLWFLPPASPRDMAPQPPDSGLFPGVVMERQWDRPWPTATSSALGSTLPVCFGRCSSLGPPTTPLPCPVGPVVTLHAVFQEVSLRVAFRLGALCSFASVLLRGNLPRGTVTYVTLKASVCHGQEFCAGGQGVSHIY